LALVRLATPTVDYPDNAESRARTDAIRAAEKQRTGDQSLLSMTEPADVSLLRQRQS
jgi:hypothetical protein